MQSVLCLSSRALCFLPASGRLVHITRNFGSRWIYKVTTYRKARGARKTQGNDGKERVSPKPGSSPRLHSETDVPYYQGAQGYSRASLCSLDRAE
ncbi:hypothetical protein B0T24DRAFT_604906 [Lasiosphaeria ovina]|uniref:Uncharacterized protein n=1 Tax=Lasiosphaeria ovina TaxID=92902 RepID=A0AAE0NL33_9PEZI|nr:hypothetical protein B0T24DRAFT_604906 [Lasiosphaeria ovina]